MTIFVPIMLRTLILLLTFALHGITVYGQNPSHYVYKDKQIGSNTVYNLIEYNHCIYAATENGIVKIDQGKTTIFKDERAVKNSFTEFQIGPDGSLYVLNFKNQLYKISDNGLQLYLNLRDVFSNPIQSYVFFEDYLYFSSNNLTKRFQIKTLKEDLNWHQIGSGSGAQIVNDTLFLGLSKVFEDSCVVNASSIRTLKQNANGSRIYKLVQKEGRSYVAVDGKIFLNESFLLDYKKYLPESSNLHYFKILDESRIWISTNSGAILINTKDPLDAEVLFKENSISDIILDEQGKVWVATLGDGIKVIPNIRIKHFPSESIISAFFSDSTTGKNYVGNVKGELFALDNLDKKSTFDVGCKIDALFADNDKIYISHLNGNSLFEGGKLYRSSNLAPKVDRILKIGNLFVFSSWHGVELTTDLMEPFEAENSFMKEHLKTVQSSVRFKQNLSPLWISEKLDRFIGLQNSKVVASSNVSIPEEVQSREYSDLQVYKNSVYLLTRFGEVWKYSAQNERFELLYHCLNNGHCQKLCVNDRGVFIYGEGIIHFLSLDGCYSYVGLIRFKHEELIEFTSDQQNLFIVYRKDLHKVPITAISKEFPISDFPIDLILKGELLSGQERMIIPPGNHSILLKFNYFDEMLSPETSISYQINGGDWAKGESNTRLQLSGLSSGEYTIVVRIDRPIGDSLYKTVRFEILPFWYETKFFYFGLSLLVLILVVLFFQKRIKSIRNRQRMENEIVQARISKINAQMKPHFIFNVLTSIQSMILREDRIQASNAIGEFAEFIRNTLDISKKESITIREELTICEKYIQLEQRRHIREFEYQVNIDSISDSVFQMQIPPLIIQPYVENAIIHGLNHLNDRKGNLSINLEEERDVLRITILDNGVGRSYKSGMNKELEKVHKSFANKANYNRVSLIKGGRVQVIDLDRGTKVIIEVPIEK